MIVPDLSAWIEERDHVAGAWVYAGNAVALGKIARGTGQGAIEQGIRAACRGRDDMFEVETVAADLLRRPALLAAAAGAALDAQAQKAFARRAASPGHGRFLTAG